MPHRRGRADHLQAARVTATHDVLTPRTHLAGNHAMPAPGSTTHVPLRTPIAPWIALAVVLGLHAFQTSWLFPTWSALMDDERPVIVVDHAIHLYHGALGARFLREHGTTWGYDPFFMAGYPETPIWDSSSNLSIAFQFLAGGRYSPRAYKLGLFACGWLTIALIAAGAFWSGLSAWETAATAGMATLVFWGSMSGVLWRSGLFSFITASAASVAVLGLLLRYDQRPTHGRWALLTVSGAALLFAHVTAPIVLLGPTLGYLAAAVRRWRLRRRRVAALVPAALLAAAVNVFWLVPLWRFRGIRSVTFSFLTADSASRILAVFERESAAWTDQSVLDGRRPARPGGLVARGPTHARRGLRRRRGDSPGALLARQPLVGDEGDRTVAVSFDARSLALRRPLRYWSGSWRWSPAAPVAVVAACWSPRSARPRLSSRQAFCRPPRCRCCCK